MSLQTFHEAVLQRWPKLFVRDTPEFDAAPGERLYFSGEPYGDGRDVASDGRQLFDYYQHEMQDYEFGVHPEIRKLAEQHDCWFEWQTCGSLFAYRK